MREKRKTATMTNNKQQTIVITMDREFGRLEARMDALEKRHKELEERIEKRLGSINRNLESMDESIEKMTHILQQGRGAMKVIGWIMAAAAAVGALITWMLDLWDFTRG